MTAITNAQFDYRIIKRIRQRLLMTQIEFAKLVPIDRVLFIKWEKGYITPPLDRQQRILEIGQKYTTNNYMDKKSDSALIHALDEIKRRYLLQDGITPLKTETAILHLKAAIARYVEAQGFDDLKTVESESPLPVQDLAI